MLDGLHHAQIIMQRADQLALISEDADRLTRRFATPALRQATDIVAGWMRNAGMMVRQDNIGNLIGCYEAVEQAAPTLILGSHLDTVRDAGKYDGPLGVLLAIACVERLHQQDRRLTFAIEVMAFADEEGLRYHTAYLGSKVVAGSFDDAYLDLRDSDGISLSDAVRAFGGDPTMLQQDARRRDDLLGYVEVHIEQGPVLQALDLPVGVVTAIAGQSRFELSFRGIAGHAGTVPMHLRKDALCAAAELVLQVEQAARTQDGLVATVGQLDVQPGASNVIPGMVTISLDVRHGDDVVREQAIKELRSQAEEIGIARGVDVTRQLVQESKSVPCSPELADLLAEAVKMQGLAVHRLPSGAGHDAVVMSAISPVGMLFVRCKDGISHNPAESVTTDDVAAAIGVTERFLELLSQSPLSR
jgi:allantoate deiminase